MPHVAVHLLERQGGGREGVEDLEDPLMDAAPAARPASCATAGADHARLDDERAPRRGVDHGVAGHVQPGVDPDHPAG